MCDSDNKEPSVMERVEKWTRDKSEETLELKAYYTSLYDNYPDYPEFAFRDPNAHVELDTTNMVIKIDGNGMTYCFAIDYWYCKQDRYVVHTTNDYYIFFVDWKAVNERPYSWNRCVSVS